MFNLDRMETKKLALITLFLASFQLGCEDRRAMPRSVGEVFDGIQPQSMELKIDGKPMPMDPESLSDANSATIAIVNKRQLTLTAMDRKNDFTLTIKIDAQDGALRPGVYDSYSCEKSAGCKDKEGKKDYTTTLLPFMGDRIPEFALVRQAYKAPAWGHEPLKVTLTSVEDSYWLGFGGVKRIKGSFKGKLFDIAEVEKGPATTVEGKFDLFAVDRPEAPDIWDAGPGLD